MSPTRVPAYGLPAGRVISTMAAWPCWNSKIRTRSPTDTASSMRAVMRRGVDTATSTPQASSNIHSFLGLLTRATVRGTPNSVLARSETTRLALSSPVAATTTSQSATPASVSAVRLAGVGLEPRGVGDLGDAFAVGLAVDEEQAVAVADEARGRWSGPRSLPRR